MSIKFKVYQAGVTIDNKEIFGDAPPADSYDFAIELKINSYIFTENECSDIIAAMQKVLLKHPGSFSQWTINVMNKEAETEAERQLRIECEVKQYYDELEERFNTEEDPAETLVEFIIADQKKKTWYTRFSGAKLKALNALLETELTKEDFE